MSKCDWPKWYEASICQFGSLMEYIRQMLNYMSGFYAWLYGWCKPPAIVLEAGCGMGLTAVTMAGMKYLVTAIDKEQSCIDMTSDLANCLGVKLEVMRKDIFDLENSARYDLAMSLGVIEHFPKDEALRMLKKLVGVSKKFVMVSVPTKLHIQTIEDKKYAPIRVIYNRFDLSELMRKAGLKVIGTYEWGQSLAVLGAVNSSSEKGSLLRNIVQRLASYQTFILVQ